MLNENHSIQLIQSEFPTLSLQPEAESSIKKLFKSVHQLAEYTKAQLRENNMREIQHCYCVAHDILVQGNSISKIAIENIFVHSVSHLMELSFAVSENSRIQFLKFFSKEYCKQINSSGI